MPDDIVIGWDIGGAHLKAALAENGRLRDVRQQACTLWLGLEHLQTAIEKILRAWPQANRHAVTMTGELVDLFTDRASGVRALIDQLSERLPSQALYVYAGRAGLLPAPMALDSEPIVIASANWLASAHYAAARLQRGVLIDIGSTTVDVIAFAEGAVLSDSVSDSDRLRRDELVYSGVVRTPVGVLARRVPFDGVWQNLAAEVFATTADVYRLLDSLPADADLMASADGRGKSLAESAARLARMLGRDAADAEPAAWRQVAAYLARRQLDTINDALDRSLSGDPRLADAPLVGAGVGRFLVRRLARHSARDYVDFGALCGVQGTLADAAAGCAPAAALALHASDNADVAG